MRTRPVFESYSDFVNALYELENEIPGFIEGLDGALNEAGSYPDGTIIRGNSVNLPGIVTSMNPKTTKMNSGWNKDKQTTTQPITSKWAEFLQVCASAQPSIANKLNSLGDYMKALLSKEYIKSDTCRLYNDYTFFPNGVVKFEYANDDIVEVKGAPNDTCDKIIQKSQFISAYDLCGRVAAYNATVQKKAFETMLSSINKQGEFKRAMKGKSKANWFMKIFGQQDIEGFEESAGMGECLYIAEPGKAGGTPVLKVMAIKDAPGSDFREDYKKRKNMKAGGQFKWPFPAITKYSPGGGQLLGVETRTKLVLPDKTKKTDSFDDVIAVKPPSDKVNFYAVNKADMTDQGKEAIVGIINQFSKIDELEVMGSADNRKPTGWKDNNELATARRDETIKYLEELAKEEGTPLSGATIKAGKITVQPSGETSNYDSWRSVKIKPKGEIYSDINNALKDDSVIEAKPVVYTEKKKGDEIWIVNAIFCMRFDSDDLDTKKERKSALSDKSEVSGD